MVAKRKQCFLKIVIFEKSVIFGGIGVSGCEEGKIEPGLLFIKHGYLQIFICWPAVESCCSVLKDGVGEGLFWI